MRRVDISANPLSRTSSVRCLMELEQRILSRIVPTTEQAGSIQEKADRLKHLVEEYVRNHGIDVEARFAGSFSKNTYLSDPDLDIFLMFPPDIAPEDLKRIGLQAGDDILHGERMFSDHPYTRGRFEGVDVDMVPCYHIDSTDDLKSAVDRTPFHTRFINSRLDTDGCNQVRLLKKFMKGIGAYGAEQDSRGFSGYLCELLVVKYGTFDGVLEAASKWRDGTVIEIDGKGPRMDGALVVYDPVDNRRNVASAVHTDTLGLFVAASRAYLAEPREEFFFPRSRPVLSGEDLSALADRHGTRVVAVRFDRPDAAIEDNLQSQLWKTQIALAKKLVDLSFNVIRGAHAMDDKHMTVAFELETDTLSKTHLHRGPPVWVKTEPFLDKWRGNPCGEPFIEDGAWNVVAERQYTSAADMLASEAGIAGIGKELDIGSMRVMDHATALSEADPRMMSELLDPRLPWEL